MFELGIIYWINLYNVHYYYDYNFVFINTNLI